MHISTIFLSLIFINAHLHRINLCIVYKACTICCKRYFSLSLELIISTFKGYTKEDHGNASLPFLQLLLFFWSDIKKQLMIVNWYKNKKEKCYQNFLWNIKCWYRRTNFMRDTFLIWIQNISEMVHNFLYQYDIFHLYCQLYQSLFLFFLICDISIKYERYPFWLFTGYRCTISLI